MRKKKLIQRNAVVSSCIASAGYDRKNKILEVEFIGGAVYRYYDLPPKIYREFITSASLGTYLNKRIKKYFRYGKVS